MKPKTVWANLAVSDLKKTQDFYLALGFQPDDQPSEDFVSFIVGNDDFVIRFFAKEQLNSIASDELSKPMFPNDVIFSFSAKSKTEVNQWRQTLEKSGGKVLFDPRKDKNKFYDDHGYYVLIFADPDDHKFNLTYFPVIDPEKDPWNF